MPYFRSFFRIAKAILFAMLVLFISLSVHAYVVSEEGTCDNYTMTVNGASATVRHCDKDLSTWEDYDEYPAGGGWYWYKSNACAYGRYCKVLCPSGCYCYGNVLDFASYTIVGCNPSSSSPIIRNDTSDESNGFIGVYTCPSAYPYSDRGSSSHQDCYKVVQVGTFVSNTSNGTVSDCTIGYYCPGKSSLTQTQSKRIYNNGSSGRFACPLGTYSTSSGGSSISDCYLCSNGYTTTSVATVGSENGQNICQVCSNSSAGVDTWTTPTKNASSNFVNNKCSIATCKTGYTKTGTGSATATSSYACTANTYTISYVMNGGTNYSGAPTSYTYGVGTTISGTPTHSYASFGGWCTDSGLTNCSNSQTISSTATGNKTFYAKWTCSSGWTGASCTTRATYTISYVMNGGTNYSGAPTSYTYGTGATISGTPTHSHAAFAGWCTDSGLTNCSNSQTISTTATGNKTFYAKWTCSSGWSGTSCGTGATYTISYVMNGGTNYSGAPTSYTYGIGVTISGTPTHSYASFGGWCTDSGLTNCSNTQTISTTATGNKTFYAKWTCSSGWTGASCTTRATYTISYVMNGGTNYSGAPTSYTYGIGATISGTPTHSHAAFAGWCTDSGLTNCSNSQTISSTATGNKTFYAKWTCSTGWSGTSCGTGATYTISYVMNGGTNYSGAPTSYTYGIGATISGTPTHSHAAFAGWCTDSGLTNCSNSQTISSTATGNKTFYAKWTCSTGWSGTSCGTGATYTISYVMNGGTNYSGAPTSYTYGIGATISGTPTHSYASFGGWCTDSGLTNCSNTQTISTTATGNKTFYAKWTCDSGWTGASCTSRATYTISYVMNGGTNYSGAPNSYTYGTGATINGTPTRTGYTFGGWCTDSGLSSCSNTQTISTTATGNKTFYAKWTANTYTISYTMNGGTNYSGAPTSYTYGVGATINGTPTRTGYTFSGWCTDSGLSSCSNTQTISTTATGNKTFYAKWTANTYTVTLNKNANDATAGTESVTATYDAVMPTPITLPTRSGYTFAGYYDTSAATGGTQYYTASGASARTWNKTSNTTLYARWTANTYTVTLNKNANDATAGTASVTATYDAVMPTPITLPTRSGYTFAGYYDTSATTGGTQYYTSSGASARTWNKTSNTTLYAHWTANTYTVTLNKNANDATAGTESVTATYDAVMPTPITLPTRSGYTFAGYYDTSATTGGTQYYTSSGSSARTWNKAANTTLYARWTICAAGSYCPADNNSYFCSTGSYSETGSSICMPCRDGVTTSGTGKTECDINCSNNAHASEWVQTLWNSSTNTVSNLCVLYKCTIGYSVLNNVCAPNHVGLSYVDSMDNLNINVEPQMCTYDEYFNLPNAPSKQGYRFLKWVLVTQ